MSKTRKLDSEMRVLKICEKKKKKKERKKAASNLIASVKETWAE